MDINPKTSSSKDVIRNIGRAGFDVITLTGFNLPKKPFEEPVIDHCAKRDGKWITGLDVDNKEIIASRRKATIWGYSETDGLLYKLKFGNQNNAPFMFLEIHSLMLHQDPFENILRAKDNIENMGVFDVWKCLDDVVGILKIKYNLNLRYDPENIRIKSAEINKTFPLLLGYYNEYDRILALLSSVLYKKKHSGSKKIGTFSSLKDEKPSSETNYLFEGKTIKVKAYNKSQEITSDEKSPFVDFNADLCRIEITANEQCLTPLSSDPNDAAKNNVHLVNVTDKAISDFFIHYFELPFKRMDEELIHHLNPYHPNPYKLNYVTEKCLLVALRNTPNFVKELLTEIYLDEDGGTPKLLDIVDYIEVLNGSSLTEEIKKMMYNELTKISENTLIHNNICKALINKRYLYDFLKIHILDTFPYKLSFGRTESGFSVKSEYIGEKEDPTFEIFNRIERIYWANIPFKEDSSEDKS